MTIAFSSLYGNESIKNLLTNQILTNTLSHAYLIVGEGGSGKTLLAKLICMALCCTNDIRPCQACLHCQKIMSMQTPDILSVTIPPDHKQITVDQIRAIREEAYLSANEMPIKAFLIEQADAMTVQAQNALLKILEEPPKNVYFFLMTHRPSALLPTIRSRVAEIKTEVFSAEWLLENLPDKNPEAQRLASRDPEAFALLIKRANGSIGEALRLLTSRKIGFDADSLAEEYLNKILFSSHAEFILFASALCKDRESFSELLQALLRAVRDITAYKKAPHAPRLFFRDEESVAELATKVTLAALLRLHDLILTTSFQNDGSSNLASSQMLFAEKARRLREF